MENINLIAIFTTGLLTGGLTCMAVQGGLLAATIAQREQERLQRKAVSGNALPIIFFLAAKLVAYTGLGFFLGWLGSFFTMSIQTQVILQLLVAVFMIGTALNILNVHPVFRYFIIQPPKFLTRFIRGKSKNSDVFAPALLGGLTVFIPCGTTQAMMALAVASGHPVVGAAVLAIYVLGTSPVFFLLGFFATKLNDRYHTTFMRIAALGIIALALYNVNGSLSLSGSKYTFGNLTRGIFCTLSYCENSAMSAAVQEATITIDANGYTPRQGLAVKAGSEVTLHLVNTDGTNCAQAFTIPSLNIQKVIGVGQKADITFTAPKKTGELAFMCSMGMYRGTIQVI